MSEAVTPGPCADCLGLADRVRAWAARYPGYDPDAWPRVLGPHPHLEGRPEGTPFRCRACGCSWSLDENPWCGYVHLDRLTEREYRRRLRPPRWVPPFWEGRWGVVASLYAPFFLASVGLASAVLWVSARDADGWEKFWPALPVFSAAAFASGWGLVWAVRGK